MSKQDIKQPLISVVMPLYNAAQYLEQAIESIQNQSYSNWELIIVDDNSTDNSLTIANQKAKDDKRIRILQKKKNEGVASATNLALSHTHGEFIARMDADDVSHPQRLEIQLFFLREHPEVVAVGSQCYLIDGVGRKIGQKTFPIKIDQIKRMMFHFYPLQQPTLMVNTTLLPDEFVWYVPQLRAAEEHELLFKLLKYGQVVNLPDFLLSYRFHDQNVSRKRIKRDFYTILRTRIKGITTYGYRPPISTILYNLIQLIVVTIIPSQYLFKLYEKVRGLR